MGPADNAEKLKVFGQFLEEGLVVAAFNVRAAGVSIPLDVNASAGAAALRLGHKSGGQKCAHAPAESIEFNSDGIQGKTLFRSRWMTDFVVPWEAVYELGNEAWGRNWFDAMPDGMRQWFQEMNAKHRRSGLKLAP